MPILYRYIMRETLALFFATNFILMSILLSFRLSALLSAAAAGKLTLGAVWQLVALQSVRFLLVLMPLAFVLAAVMTISRLYRDSEMTAALALGIAPRHLRRALLLCAIPIAGALIYLNLAVMPNVYQQQETLRQKAQQEAGLILFTPNTFRRLADGTVVHTGGLRAGRLENFFIAQAQPEEQSVITAAAGWLTSDDTGRHLQLSDGRRLAWSPDHDPSKTTLMQFHHADLRLPDDEVAPDSHRLRNIPTSQLSNNAAGQSEWQTRLNPALALLFFTLFIPWLAKTPPRAGRYQKILPTFLLFAIYINALGLLAAAVKKGKLLPFPGSFSLHLIVGALFVFLLWRAGRKASSV